MSDSSNKSNVSSYAAFVFLPQFGNMFRSASHIIPIFMRTIAGLLVQAGLLPPTHPATLYGDDGVEKCKFSEMMGDAWYTLRSTDATPYQWSVFSSVVLIIFFIISSLLMTVINLSSVFITSAAAQVFTNWAGTSTNIGTLNQDPSTALWDKHFPALGQTGVHASDYAIAFLDDILRLGAAQKGTPMQNALGGLMQTYNAGIMVIAGIMLFWLILSVVVDTAKTGTIGGGRHNMVWAPIRIVFALGLMVPLGASGFSSGQFMVMKIAELGSNFGSNAWKAYMQSVQAPLLYKLPPQKNLMKITHQLLRSWVCIVAANGYSDQAEGSNLPNAQIVYRYDNLGEYNTGQKSFSYRKLTGSNECGTIIYPDPANNKLLMTQLMQASPNGGSFTITQYAPGATSATQTAHQTYTIPGTNNISGQSTNDPIALAKIKFKIAMLKVWAKMFSTGPYMTPTINSPNGTGASAPQPQTKIEQIANAFACGFVSQHIWGLDNGNKDVLHLNCQGGTSGNNNVTYETANGISCGGGLPDSGDYPKMKCVADQNPYSNIAINNIMQQTILTNIENNYNAYFGSTLGNQIKNEAWQHGWADMGLFFQDLSSVNRFILNQSTIPVTIIPGSVPPEGGLSEKINQVLSKFDKWWQLVPLSTGGLTTAQTFKGNTTTTANGTNPGVDKSPASTNHKPKGFFGWLSSAVSGVAHAVSHAASTVYNMATGALKQLTDPLGFFANKVGAAIHGSILQEIAPDIQDKTVYPLSVLTKLGSNLMHIGIDIELALSGVVALLAIIPMENIGDALANTSLATLFSTVALIFLTTGATLAYWIPTLPLIRVAFAVLAWAAAVFEAVALVPIAALSFLSTTGEGWDAKHVFLNWLDVFTRPVLTVIGFVGALLLFNTFFSYFYVVYKGYMASLPADTQSGITGLLVNVMGLVSYTVIFFMVIYGAANTCFKMVSTIPDAFFRWAPIGGSRSGSAASMGDGGDHGSAGARGAGTWGESMNRGRGADSMLTGKGVRKGAGAIKNLVSKTKAEEGGQ